MEFDGYNLQSQDISDVIDVAQAALSVELDRTSPAFGSQAASVGIGYLDSTRLASDDDCTRSGVDGR